MKENDIKTEDANVEAVPTEPAEYAIEVRDLKIRYRTLQKVSIKEGLKGLFKNKVESFEAVRGVSFNVPKGQIIGLIGKNGSGKSTILRAIAGIFSPDEGQIDLHGHSVSLLSIGVGFNKRLTGRENIYLSGLLMGFTEPQIAEHEEEIIEFSELGPFIDKPVSTYSSGMHSKLAFSITAVLEAEIMLIDEVFSVGDARFKKKSFERMQQLIEKNDRTVVIVSHNINTIKTMCQEVIWIHEGQFVMQGPAKKVVRLYNGFTNNLYEIEDVFNGNADAILRRRSRRRKKKKEEKALAKAEQARLIEEVKKLEAARKAEAGE